MSDSRLVTGKHDGMKGGYMLFMQGCIGTLIGMQHLVFSAHAGDINGLNVFGTTLSLVK